jgi:hypothetical protein
MASTPTPGWVKAFIGVIAVAVAIAVILHLTGLMPRMHNGMP